MKFIDLFAGLGGFHLALSRLNHECVFASDIDPELIDLYEKNFGIKPSGDIRKSYKDIPSHDILCAGFPCQPFSKAGGQQGFECPQWGDLFGYIIKILKRHQPKFIIIENVPNLMRHNDGKTWKNICRRLENAGYDIKSGKLSPKMFGVPQTRERAFIVGCKDGLDDFTMPEATHKINKVSINSVLDKRPAEAKLLAPHLINYLETWQRLLDKLPANSLPSFPIWAMEFGANYPIKTSTPKHANLEKLRESKGAFGKSLKGLTREEIFVELPVYARDPSKKFPEWKIQFIEQNRKFYLMHKEAIDAWLPSIRAFAPSFQKLEWNWKGGPQNLWETIIQFRASGIRAKKPTAAPSLVALTTSQVPVIAWERRYMTMLECARLQSMGDLDYLPETQGSAYKALGNAVNVEVIHAIAKRLIGKASPSPQKNCKNAEIVERYQTTEDRGLAIST